MEGFEESVPKAQTDGSKSQTDQQELGLGFQSSHSADDDPNIDPPPPPAAAAADDRVRQAADEDKQNDVIADHVLQNQQSNTEELQNQQSIAEELQTQQYINEEFQIQQTISEGLVNLVLEEEEKVSEKVVDRGGSVEQAGNEADEKGSDHEVAVEGEDGTDNGNAKSELGVDAVSNEDDDERERSEDEKEDEDGNENVGEQTDALEGLKEGRNRRYPYPVRPDVEDCSYYMRTGTCKFGSNCKFNHPPKRRNQVKEWEENSERLGQIECKYYLTSGGCKFGKSCRYNHSRGKTPVAPIIEFNFLGLPIRPGEKECPFYMRNGSCKYGSNCKFNHPDPTTTGGGDNPSGYVSGGSASLRGVPQTTASSWSPPRPLNETGSFVPVMFSPPQAVPTPNLGWNGYQNQASVYQAPERRLPTPPAFALNNPAESNFYTYNKQQTIIDEFPERPGQPECTYFMKTGDCKFKSGCKFHHPKSRIVKTTTCALSDIGLPLRPDQNICSYYSRYGICKFGPACRFNHPVNLGQSTSSSMSGSDMPSVIGNSVTADGATDGWE
ncbi:hypothetical protein NMG60_11002898 [Bertholletia excelsa]